jgi:predicted nucleic acid-binding protein
MTNDSVTVALMRQMELTAIATYDVALDNIAGVRVYQPGDIP